MITFAIVAVVYRKLGRRFKPEQGTKVYEEQSSQTWGFSEGKEALSVSYALHNSSHHGHPSWDKENTLSGSRPDTIGNHFICQNCSLSSRRKAFHPRSNCRGIQPDFEEEWSTYLGSDQWKSTDVCPVRIKDEGIKCVFFVFLFLFWGGVFLFSLDHFNIFSF